MKKYQELTEQINRQLNPDNLVLNKSFREELSAISYNDVLKFVKVAMKGVELEYTKRTTDAGNKVKQHLNGTLTEVSYKYQGSVMTDTHIKGHSDIDLLVITNKFYGWDLLRVNEILSNAAQRSNFSTKELGRLEYEKSLSPYEGHDISDLLGLRTSSEGILQDIYTDCDITKPMAIQISNRSLKRDVDIVIANWHDDVTSIVNDKGEYRGIQVFNKETRSKGEPDYPFLSIKLINERGALTNGRLKRMIRFLKHIKAHLKLQSLSSFDINAICYNIDMTLYNNLAYYELVDVLYEQLHLVYISPDYANRIKSVDGREYVFKGKPEKVVDCKSLMDELAVISSDLKKAPIYG